MVFSLFVARRGEKKMTCELRFVCEKLAAMPFVRLGFKKRVERTEKQRQMVCSM